MIVDDQANIRYLIAEVLQDIVQRILTAGNGQKALEILEKKEIDLILLDMKMPSMNGLETLKLIKERGFRNKIVMMTAHNEQEIIKQAEELGVRKFLSKPFDIMELRQIVYTCFQEEEQKVLFS